MYAEEPKTGRLRWHRSRRWTTEDVAGLGVWIADRAEAWLARHGYGTGALDEEVEDDALSLIQSRVVIGARNRKGLRADAIPIAAVGTRDPKGVARHSG